MLWGCCASILVIIIILLAIYFFNYNTHNTLEPFLTIDDTKLQDKIATLNKQNDPPVEIQHQIPAPANQLSSEQSMAIDSDVLRNVRVLKNFSMTDEFDSRPWYFLVFVSLLEFWLRQSSFQPQ